MLTENKMSFNNTNQNMRRGQYNLDHIDPEDHLYRGVSWDLQLGWMEGKVAVQDQSPEEHQDQLLCPELMSHLSMSHAGAWPDHVLHHDPPAALPYQPCCRGHWPPRPFLCSSKVPGAVENFSSGLEDILIFFKLLKLLWARNLSPGCRVCPEFGLSE